MRGLGQIAHGDAAIPIPQKDLAGRRDDVLRFLVCTPKRAARVGTRILLNESGQTGIYYDDGGLPMVGSPLGRDPKFTDRVVAETRAFQIGRASCRERVLMSV